MMSKRNFLLVSMTIGIAVAGIPGAAMGQIPLAAIQAAIEENGGSSDIRGFYEARAFRPFWTSGAQLRPEARRLLRYFETAELDDLKSRKYLTRSLRSAIDKMSEEPSAEAVARTEQELSRSFAAYVQDLRKKKGEGLSFTDPALKPPSTDKLRILAEAASATSLASFVDKAGWAHPLYGQLRIALATAPEGSRQEKLLRLNLERARHLPAASSVGRHIVVDAAGARLMMYDKGSLQGTMKVVVGTEESPTPMMAGLIRYASVNPYWNIPPNLVRNRIAPGVVANGTTWLKARGYEVLSDWSDSAKVTDPSLVNWKAVAAGGMEVRVRQRPGPANAMGRVKFMFPNDHGVYLHDTPEKGLFGEDSRQFSNGCVRVENAARLATWLFGKPLATKSSVPEKNVDLPTPVPVYLTYFTVFPEGNRIAMRTDFYGRDGEAGAGKEMAGLQ